VPNLSFELFAYQILLVRESSWYGANNEHAGLNVMKALG
jgi:hypothetical protein